MPVQILQFRTRPSWSRDWSQHELAEFYRVENALLQAGVQLESERGVSDEGDPWYIFCRRESGEVFIHFARIDGEYLIDGAPYAKVARHHNFSALVRDLISSELITLARPRRKDSNVFVHPAALLIALVGAAFFHSGKADAAETGDHRVANKRAGGLNFFSKSRFETLVLGLDADQTATVVSGIMIGVSQQLMLPSAPAQGLPADTDVASFASLMAQAPQPASTRTVVITGTSAAAAFNTNVVPTGGPIAWSVADVGVGAKGFGLTQPALVLDIAVQSLVTAAVSQAVLVSPGPLAVLPVLLSGALAPASLPDDEAGAAVKAAASGDHAPIALAGKIPVVITDLIGRGQHVDPSAAPAPGAPPAPSSPPPPAATDTAPAVTGGSGGDGGDNAAPPPAVAVATATSTPTVSTDPPTGGHTEISAAPSPGPPPSEPVQVAPVAATPSAAAPSTPAPSAAADPGQTSSSTPVPPAAVVATSPSIATKPPAPDVAHVSATPPATAPTAIVAPIIAAPTPAADATAHAHDAYINAAVSGFMAEAQHWQVLVDGRDMVVYDPIIFGHPPPDTKFDSITFTFSDGSSVSLVGTAQEINDTYHVHPG